MNSPATRATLLRCRATIVEIGVNDELHVLAVDLIDYMVCMIDAQRLRGSVVLLALGSLELVPGLEECTKKLRVLASEEVVEEE